MNNLNSDMVVSAEQVEAVANFFGNTYGNEVHEHYIPQAVRTGKRAYIKAMLSRNNNYRLSDYTRKIGKLMGQELRDRDIMGALKRMAKGGQIEYAIEDGFIIGWMTK